jgi:transcriptional regulator with XRE-family HTH domain
MNAEEVNELLELRGWSQKELARRFGISTASISRWAAGITVPNKPTRQLISQWLDEARKEARESQEPQPA